MTVMDKICGWGEEDKWAGSLFGWTRNHAELLEEKDAVNHGECQLGL